MSPADKTSLDDMMAGWNSRRGARPFTGFGSDDDIPPENRIQPVSTPPDAYYYKMDHPERGLALIFNHEIFCTGLKQRDGTNLDCSTLSSCLTKLGFKVRDYQNLKFEDITKVLAEGMDHKDYDCLVVAVLTHGDLGILNAYDTHYNADIIWSYFTANKCPSLKNKPKIFFIQACQGKEVQGAVTLKERTALDCRNKQKSSIRAYPDFLIAYSTIPGHCSWRHRNNGSWFISALCLELNDNGKTCDLLTILTFVCQRVAIDFETENQKKQNPCITSMLKYLVQFK